MRKLLVGMLPATMIVSSCNLAPPYTQPAAPIPAAYPDKPLSGAVLATNIGWQSYFGDSRLRAFIAAALANNRDLAASVARIDQARAQFRLQNAERLPEIDAGGSGNRTRTPISVIGAQSGSTIPSSSDHVTSSIYSGNVAITSFELDFWGRVRNQSEAARHHYLASVEGTNAFRLSLISDVAATYFSIIAGEEGIALAQKTVLDRQKGLDIAKLRLDAGVTSIVDYDQAALLVKQAQTELADLQRTTEQSRNQLMVLVGGPILTALPAGRSITDQQQFAAIDAGLPSELLINRPDVREAEQNLQAGNANIGAARAAFFPSISLTSSFGFESAALGNLFKGASQAWSYGLSVDMPLLDWGRRKQQLAISKAAQRELVATYQKTVQEAFREVADGLVARRRYQEQIVAEEQTVITQRSLADNAELRYKNGVSIYLEVLDARRNLFSAQQSLIQLRSTALQNGVSLYVALGGAQQGNANIN